MTKDLTKIFILSNVDNINMERFLIYCEHLGILSGGAWGENKATMFLDPHQKDCDCDSAIPNIEKLTDHMIDLITGWCGKNAIIVENIMTHNEYEDNDLIAMGEELLN